MPRTLRPCDRKLPTGVGFQGGVSVAGQAQIMALAHDKPVKVDCFGRSVWHAHRIDSTARMGAAFDPGRRSIHPCVGLHDHDAAGATAHGVVWHHRRPIWLAGFRLHLCRRCLGVAGRLVHRPVRAQAFVADPLPLVCLDHAGVRLGPVVCLVDVGTGVRRGVRRHFVGVVANHHWRCHPV